MLQKSKKENPALKEQNSQLKARIDNLIQILKKSEREQSGLKEINAQLRENLTGGRNIKMRRLTPIPSYATRSDLNPEEAEFEFGEDSPKIPNTEGDIIGEVERVNLDLQKEISDLNEQLQKLRYELSKEISQKKVFREKLRLESSMRFKLESEIENLHSRLKRIPENPLEELKNYIQQASTPSVEIKEIYLKNEKIINEKEQLEVELRVAKGQLFDTQTELSNSKVSNEELKEVIHYLQEQKLYLIDLLKKMEGEIMIETKPIKKLSTEDLENLVNKVVASTQNIKQNENPEKFNKYYEIIRYKEESSASLEDEPKFEKMGSGSQNWSKLEDFEQVRATSPELRPEPNLTSKELTILRSRVAQFAKREEKIRGELARGIREKIWTGEWKNLMKRVLQGLDFLVESTSQLPPIEEMVAGVNALFGFLNELENRVKELENENQKNEELFKRTKEENEERLYKKMIKLVKEENERHLKKMDQIFSIESTDN